ncbi:hypothetical protein GCM10010420_36800 [Streptomyces glaucosporus]|uniref:Uncharacterized protein n=1 Tax=Streptomyces glaucosporus TaxID=284044 RepID=A0ABN3II72_9ACTN
MNTSLNGTGASCVAESVLATRSVGTLKTLTVWCRFRPGVPGQFENIWLRTKRYNANGQVRSGTGGICYVIFPAKPAPAQHRVLRELGIC